MTEDTEPMLTNLDEYRLERRARYMLKVGAALDLCEQAAEKLPTRDRLLVRIRFMREGAVKYGFKFRVCRVDAEIVMFLSHKSCPIRVWRTSHGHLDKQWAITGVKTNTTATHIIQSNKE